MKTPGPEAIRLLSAVNGLCSTGEIAVAQIRDLAKKLGKSRTSVAKTLNELKKLEYVQNPIWGGWRLAPKGKELLMSLAAPFNPKKMSEGIGKLSEAFEFLYEIREAAENAKTEQA